MGDRPATVVIEARLLMRAALVSLMESHSYKVICSVGSAADIDARVLKEEQPELVLLGPVPTDLVADATSNIRRCWQRTKIIMLLENASSKDLQTLLASDVDACIPLSALPGTLMDTLQLIVCEPLRILMVGRSAIPQALIDEQERQALVADLASSVQAPPSIAMPCARGLPAKDAHDGAAKVEGVQGLSEREEQIVKALVRGYSNKMIARMCSLTEATVKVYMKSIRRKVGVANRTQAAIWALRNTSSLGGINEEEPRTPKDVQEGLSIIGHRH